MNRDMYYGSYQGGGFTEPNMINMPPSGYNMTSSYQAFGPNIIPYANNTNNQIKEQNTYSNIDEYESRISKLERQITRLDQRVKKLESLVNSNVTNIEEDITNNFTDIHMI